MYPPFLRPQTTADLKTNNLQPVFVSVFMKFVVIEFKENNIIRKFLKCVNEKNNNV